MILYDIDMELMGLFFVFVAAGIALKYPFQFFLLAVFIAEILGSSAFFLLGLALIMANNPVGIILIVLSGLWVYRIYAVWLKSKSIKIQ